MSEFYLLRRSAIADATAVLGFLVGFVGSAPIAWPYLQVGFQTGEITKGFAYFIGVICGSGVAGGLAGLAIGSGAAWFWEQGHRSLRRAREGTASRDRFMAAVERSPARATVHAAFTPVTADAPPILLRDGGIDGASYADLLSRAFPGFAPTAEVIARLATTTNIGVWDGDRLVGIARVAKGGPHGPALMELLLDPSIPHRQLATDLAARALRVAEGI